jgi:hypothetical protein
VSFRIGERVGLQMGGQSALGALGAYFAPVIFAYPSRKRGKNSKFCLHGLESLRRGLRNMEGKGAQESVLGQILQRSPASLSHCIAARKETGANIAQIPLHA